MKDRKTKSSIMSSEKQEMQLYTTICKKLGTHAAFFMIGHWKIKNMIFFSGAWLADQLLVPLVFLASLVLAFLGKVGITLAQSGPCDCGHAIHKLGLEQDVGIGEHAILKGHHHKLQGENMYERIVKTMNFSFLKTGVIGDLFILMVRSSTLPASAWSVCGASVQYSVYVTDPGQHPPRPRCRWEQVWTVAWPEWETRPQGICNTQHSAQ